MRSLRQRVSLPLYPDDPGEIIEHRAKSIEQKALRKWRAFCFRDIPNPLQKQLNMEQQNHEVITSIFGIPCSIFCGLES